MKAVYRKDYSSNLKLSLTFMVMTLMRLEILSFPQSLTSKGFLTSLLILVLSSTNAASERTFSAMKGVKTCLRTTMTQLRWNHIKTLNIYKDTLNKVDLINIASEFEHRLRIFVSYK